MVAEKRKRPYCTAKLEIYERTGLANFHIGNGKYNNLTSINASMYFIVICLKIYIGYSFMFISGKNY